MTINNPFESGHIKNYILLYVSVVVIMILFFIASSIFLDDKTMEKKIFNTTSDTPIQTTEILHDNSVKKKFKLLDKNPLSNLNSAK